MFIFSHGRTSYPCSPTLTLFLFDRQVRLVSHTPWGRYRHGCDPPASYCALFLPPKCGFANQVTSANVNLDYLSGFLKDDFNPVHPVRPSFYSLTEDDIERDPASKRFAQYRHKRGIKMSVGKVKLDRPKGMIEAEA